MVETPQGTYALGGSDGDWNPRSEVFKLVCPGDQIQSCQWQEMPEKLEVGRLLHVSLSLPESYDICNWTIKKIFWFQNSFDSKILNNKWILKLISYSWQVFFSAFQFWLVEICHNLHTVPNLSFSPKKIRVMNWKKKIEKKNGKLRENVRDFSWN